MGEETTIPWCHHTFNGWWGCDEVSPACDNCYARVFSVRLGMKLWGAKADRRLFGDKHWAEPHKWNRAAKEAGVRRRVFCGSMKDVLDDRRDLDVQRARLWELVEATPMLDWLLLTKRPKNARRLMPAGWWSRGFPANVWFGTTIEDRERWRLRIDALRAVPAVVRFVSLEPLLEGMGFLDFSGVDWAIVGGESVGGRRFDAGWARSIRDQAFAQGIAFHMKQMGANVVDRDDVGFSGEMPEEWPEPKDVERNINGFREDYQGALVRIRLRDSKHGEDMAEWPEDLRIREFPEPRRTR